MEQKAEIPGKRAGAFFARVVLALMLLVTAGIGIWLIVNPDSGGEVAMKKPTTTEIELAKRLEGRVRALAGDIGERNMQTPAALEEAAGWIEVQMRDAGYTPERQTYRLKGGFTGKHGGQKAANLVAELPGSERPDEILVVGAHYDTVYGSPGANDNASAVAVLLTLAEWFESRPQPRTVRFVAFVNEEPPFFHTRQMGSYAYARQSRELGEQIVAMMSMDGLGYFSDEPGSQSYPLPGLGFLYPKKADFIGFVTRLRDSGLLNRALGAFRKEAAIASEGAALPGFIPGVYWSDHWSFWKNGYSAFLVTDTLLFRDPMYHSPFDTPERLDYIRMARVARGLKEVVKHLAR